MKKFFALRVALVFLFCFAGNASYAFNANQYTYNYSSGAVYSSISGTGTAVGAGILVDDGTVTSINIGFTFSFCGTPYSTLSACSNGFVSLANSGVTTYTPAAGSIASTGWLMPYWRDLYGGGGATAYYQTTGSAPYRVFTIEYKNWNNCCTYGTNQMNFQVKLYESYNIIQFCYGSVTAVSSGGTIGIANSTGDYQTISSPTATTSTAGTFYSISSPASGTVYTWSPIAPSSCTPANASACSSFSMFARINGLTGVNGTINDPNGCGAGVYDNATNFFCALTPGTAYSVTFTTGYCGGTMAEQTWIDFNDNGLFETTESVGGVNMGACSLAGTLTIPGNATPGLHRMRVESTYYGCCGGSAYPNVNPCPTGAITYGDGRDYSVYIAPPPPSVTAVPTTVAFGIVTQSTNSAAQTFSLSGANMTSSPVTVTAPANYQVSSDGATWVTSYTISYTIPTLSATTVYVRFNAPAIPGPYNGNVAITGGGLAATYNIAVTGTSAVACSGTPTAGTATGAPTSGSTTTSFTLSLTGATVAGSLTYQWQSSPDNSTWSNVSGATNATYTFSGLTASTYYRCVVTCTISGLSANSLSQLITFVLPASCTPAPSQAANACTSWFMTIQSLNLVGECGSSISDALACNSTGYRDRTALSCNLAIGSTYNVTIGTGSTYAQYTQFWIDFNNDGVFQNTEIVGGNTTAFTTSGTVTINIPTTASPGAYKMRVVTDWSGDGHSYSTMDPCMSGYNYGEGRDYKVIIVNPAATYFYTGAVQTFTVPTGVTSLAVDMQGAMGGTSNPNYSRGGYGGRVQCNLAVTAGQVLNIYVGGVGANGTATTAGVGGFNGGGNGAINSSSYVGGGGGGASDIRVGGTSLANRLVAAGGGGGAGQNYNTTNYEQGGAGGGLTGANGYADNILGGPSGDYAGYGGTPGAGGIGGLYPGYIRGSSGITGTGGAASISSNGGGGGGGGYYGAGGGCWSGGGGGSSYTDAVLGSGVIHTQGYNSSGNGIVKISPIWYSTTTGGDATNLNNWWSNNNNTGTHPCSFAGTLDIWIVQSALTCTTTPFTLGGSLVVLSGTSFTAPSGILTIGGYLNNIGTFTATSSTTNIGGNFSNTGTFTHNSGTVNFNGTTTGIALSGAMTGTNKFNHLTFNGVGGAWTFGANSADIAGNFTITNGTVTAPSTTLQVAGNFTNNGTFTHNGGTVNLNGTTAQAVSGGGAGSLVYSQVFTNGVTAVAQCTAWTAYVATLLATYSYTSVTMSGTLDLVGHTTVDPVITANLAAALRTNTIYGPIISAGISWYASNGDGGHAITNTGGSGNCSVGYTIRPCIGNLNWGGINGNTCGGATQTMTITFNYATPPTTFNNFTNSNTTAAVSVTSNINVAGTLNMNGAATLLTPAAAVVINSTATAGTISGTGTVQVTRTTATADFINQYKFTTNTLGSMTVDYTANAAQSVNGIAQVGNYGTLKTSTGGTKTLEQAVVVNTNVNIGVGTTLDVVSGSNYQITDGGSWVNNGTFSAQAGTVLFNSASGGNTLAGTMTTTSKFNNITFNGAGAWAFSNNADVGTNFTITAGTVTAPATLQVAGNWSNTGTFTHNSGTVIMNSATAGKTLSGTMTTTNQFNNLTFNTGGGWTLSNNADVAGNFTITSGTVTAPPTLQVAGNWSNSGTFTNGGGTVVMNASTSGKTLSGTMTTTSKFNNLTFTNGGGWTFSNNADIGAGFTITSGTVTAPPTLQVAGNWSNSGTYTSSGGLVNFNGGPAQTWGGSSGTNFGSVTISNSNGVSLTSVDETISGTLTLTTGRITLGGFNLILGTATPAVAGVLSSANMIVINGSGQLRKLFTANGSYLYPVGDNAPNYSPITLNLTGGTYGGGAYASVTVTNAKHPNNANTADFLNRYWTVTTSAITSPSYAVTAATYVPGDVSGTEGNLSMGQYTGALPWVKFGVTNTGTHTLTSGTVTNTTSDFTGISTAGPTVTSTATTTICTGGTIAISALTPQRDGPFSYTWSPSTGLSATTGANVSATVSVPTTNYIVTMTDGNGFTTTSTTTINTVAQPSVTGYTTVPASVNMCQGAVINLAVTSTGGTGTPTYTWTGPGITGTTTTTPASLTYTTNTTGASTYSVTLGYSGIGCNTSAAATTPLTYTVAAQPSVTGYTTLPALQNICQGGVINLGVTSTGGSGTPTYTWSGPGITGTTATTPASLTYTTNTTGNGTYSVTVGYTGTGCNTSAAATTASTYTVAAQPAITSYTTTPASQNICQGGVINLAVTSTGGSGTPTYTWSGPGITGTSTTTPASLTYTTNTTGSGTYSVTLGYSGTGCTTTAAATTTLTYTVAPQPAVTGYTTTPASQNICQGGVINLAVSSTGGSGTPTYTWSGPGITGTTATTPASLTYTTNTTGSGTYSVTLGYSGTGCTTTTAATTTLTYTVAPQPAITGYTTTPASQNICQGGVINLGVTSTGGSGTPTYTWSGPGITGSPTTTPASLTYTTNTTSSGTYSVTLGYSGTGCTTTAAATTTLTYTVAPQPAVTGYTTTPASQNICQGGVINLAVSSTGGSGTPTYTWSGPGITGTTATTPASLTYTTNTTGSGTYSVTLGYSGTGCNTTAAATTTLTYTVAPQPAVTGYTTTPALQNICQGGVINLAVLSTGGSGTPTYTWSGPGITGTTATTPASLTYTTNTTGNGTYSVTVGYTGIGCNTSAVATTASTYTVAPQPVITGYTTTPASQNICQGGVINLAVTSTGGSGTPTYTWSGPGITGTSTTTPASLTYTTNTTGSGTYSVTLGYSGTGCTTTAAATTTLTYTVAPQPAVTGYTTTPASQNICQGGVINLAVTSTGGSGTPTYTWSGPGITGTSTTTPASLTYTTNTTGSGTYSVTLGYSGTGCTTTAAATTTLTYTVAPQPAVTGYTTTPASQNICQGGVINLAVSSTGGSGTPTYTWSGPGITGTTATTPASLTYTTNTTGSGTYSVTLGYSGTGCTTTTAATTTLTYTVAPQPAITGYTTTPASQNICQGGVINLAVTSTGGSGTPTYTWSGPGITGTSTTTPASLTYTTNTTGSGTYSVTLGYSGTGCTTTAAATTTLTYTVAPQPAVTGYTTTPASQNICQGGVINLAVSSTGGSGTPTYTWSGPGITGTTATTPASLTYTTNTTGSGTYSVTLGYSGTGCTTTTAATTALTYTVAAQPSLISYTTLPPTQNICMGGTINLGVNSSGGSGIPTYTWTGPGITSSNTTAVPTLGYVSNALGNGKYNVTLAYTGLGCNTTAPLATALTYTVNPVPTAAPTYSGPICNGGTITLNANPGGSTNTYTWAGSNLSSTTAQNPTATPTVNSIYSLTVSFGVGNPGCSPATIYTTSATVHQNPDISNFTPPTSTSPCVGSGATVTVNSTSLGSGTFTVTYNLSAPNAATGLTATLTMGTSNGTFNIPSTALTNTGPTGVTITSLSNVFGCNTAVSSSNSVTFTVNTLPDISNFTSPSATSPCLGFPSVVTVNSTSLGAGTYTVTYDLSAPNFATGLTATLSMGTSNGTFSIPSSVLGSTGSTTVTITSVTNGTPCSISISGSNTASFIVKPIPAAITGSPVLCVGFTTNLSDATPAGIWSSSNTAQATVGTSGIVSGISAGTPTISYTVAGCFNTVSVVVNPAPAPILGTYNICQGFTTTLSDGSGGGTWSSGAPGTASVGSTTGTVTGLAAGTATITYSIGVGCFTSTPVTVNPNPGPIGGGTTVICVATTTTLTDGLPGGAWTSSNIAQATVGTGGVVTGISAGNPYITYTMPTGCNVTTPTTINPLPASITGSTNVCIGLTTTLADATSGGTWSSLSPGIASIGSSTGIVTGIGSGTATIVYTLTATGCTSATTVTVNANPGSLTGITNVCTGLTTTLSYTPAGGTWTSSDITMATVGSASGIVSGISAGSLTLTYTLGTGCAATTPFTVNQTPVAIAGTTNVCVGSTTALSDFTSGGTWSSSDPSKATVGSGTGIVTGVANGTPNIIYTMPAGCNTLTPVTVNPLPLAIGGTTTVCVGLTTTLIDGTAGGNWTSSNITLATIGTSGTVTGVSSGTLNISYTLPTGCLSAAPFTVNPVPVAISGATTVCAGATTTFSDGTTGGTWSSAVPGTASVGSSTGIVTGVASGSTNIIYTLPAGCTATKPITVNPSPAAITGVNTVCIGFTTTLSNTVGGGTWSSSNPAMATVGSTGVVTGISVGTPVISYVLPAGCTATQVVSVNTMPAAITGIPVVCAGSNTTLSDATVGGTWSSSNTAVATVGSTTGVVSGVAGGNATITYSLGLGCTATNPLTVNPVPNISVFSPSASSLCIGTASTVTVSSTSLGSGTFTATYDLSGANSSTSNTATLTMGSSTGTFSIPLTSLPNTGSTTVTINYITNGSGCNSNLTSGNTSTFNVFTLPTAYAVMGTGSYCFGGTGVHVFLPNSDAGVNYQLFLGASPVGSPVAGTGASLDLGAQTTAGTYTVVGTNPTTTCTNNMSGSAVITVNPLPVAFSLTGGGGYCAGGTGIAVGLSNSASGVNYQLYNGPSPSGSPVAGTGGSISFGLQTAGGIYTVVATNTTTSCTNNMTGSATVIVNPLPAAITGTTNACVGANTTLSDGSAGGTWSSVNTAVATIGSSSGFVTGVTSGTSVISYTLPTGCAISTTVTVNPPPSAIAGSGTICTGSTLSLTDPTGGGTWTSSNPLEATVGAGTGIVTGVAAGTPTITYTLTTGCIATTSVTVNTTPVAITGTAIVCPGATTTLFDATGGGSWSSSNIALATIGAGTGVVTGIAAGIPTMTYSAAGCIAIATVTVNPLPSAISGAASVCVGSTTTLSNATTGGSWSSSNPSLATVGSGTGVVSGVAAGTVTITYTLSTGCLITAPFTVNPLPSAITGVSNVCVGLTTTLGDLVTGGTWSSSNTAQATVGTGSGIVTGISAGVPTITYTLSAGCSTVFPMTVNALPATISGTASVCVGLATTLSDATTGGSWSSSNPSLATIGSGTGVVSGVAPGTVTITYALPTGCIATQALTINPLPSAITGSAAVCAGQATPLSDATGGGTWSSSNPGVATVVVGTGVVTGVSAGTVTITYALSTGCIATTPMTINPTPAAISGTATLCTGLTATLSDATAGGSWSSSDITRATVGSGTGIVTGIAAGAVNIIYTLPAGCTATLPMTVNLQPAAITGSATVCTGQTTILSDATSGGTWASGNPAVATIGSTGIVSGITSGTVTISYSLPTGCLATTPMTVNPSPASITGTAIACVSSTANLADAITGGTWSSSNIALAIVGSGTGIVTGVSAGTGTITYTLPAGCIATTPFTINPLPASVTGVPVVCVNATTTIADATTGGTWSSSNTALAAIGSTGIVTGIAAGTPVFTYTLSTGCLATIAGTVNALPSLYSMTGGGAYCAGGTGVTVGLSNSSVGITYQLMRGVTTVGSPIAGTGSALSYGLQTIAGVYTVVATNTATGCFVTMSGSATVTVNTLPTVFTVTGGGAYCSGGTGMTIGLSGSQTGINYQLYNGASPSGSPVAGTGGVISFGLQTAAGVYTVVATNTTTGCISNMTGSAVISINPSPTVYTITGGGEFCTGGTGVHIGLSNSDVTTSYQLMRGIILVTTVTGTGSSLDFGLQTVGGTYTVIATNTITTCTNTMSGSVTITINSLPTAYSVTGTGSYCSGGTGVAIGLSNSQTGVSYQLFLGISAIGTPVAGLAGSAISFGLQTATGTYTVVAINTTTTCTNNMTGSAVITINPLPAVFGVTGGGSFCAGGIAPHVFLSGSALGINYQLFRGTTPLGIVAGTGVILDFGTQAIAGNYTVVATNPVTLCTNNMSGTAVVVVNPLPVIYNVTGGGAYCTSGTGVHVGLSSSDAGVNYQLFLGVSTIGSPIAGTGAALDFGLQVAAGTYTVVATNVATLCTSNMTGTAVITINALPIVYNVSGGGSYCTGGTGMHVGLSNSTSGVSYQLYNGVSTVGSPLAGSGSPLDFGLLTVAGTYTIVATNTTTLCTNIMFGSATITINPLPPVNIVTGGGVYCAGGTGVHIGLNGSVSGSTYQLYNGTVISGVAVAGTGAPLDFGLRTTAGTYTVVATTTTSGCTNNMAGSVVITINPLPTAFTVTGGGSYCTGGTGMHVGLNNSTIGTSYQLNIGGTPVGAPLAGTGTALDFGLQTTTGTYTVAATNTTTLCTGNMTGSVTIATNPLPSVYTVTGGGNYCAGGTGVHVGLSSSGGGISYQLYNGISPVGTPIAGTGLALDFGLQTAPGTYTVTATNTTTSCTANMTGSAVVVLNTLPVVYTVTGGGSYCVSGTGVLVGLSSSDAATSYQLYMGTVAMGSAVAGTGTALSFGLQALPGIYTVIATNGTVCTATMSGSVTVIVNSLPGAYNVTGGGSYCAGGTGVNVGLDGSATGINYQLYNGTSTIGSPVAGTGSMIDFGVLSVAGSYTVVAINSTTACTNNMTGSASITVNALPVAYAMTGGGSYCTGGTGFHVGLGNSTTGVNYQLYKGTAMLGSPVGGTGLALDFGLETAAGVYTVVATNAVSGCTRNMPGSATITINTLPTAFTVTGGGSYCSGGTAYHVGLSGSVFGVSYQLYNGTSAVGSPVAGNGAVIDFGIQTVAGIYTVIATNTSTGCTKNMTGSATITVNTLPAIHVVSGGGSYCAGGTGVHVGQDGSDLGISYQLYRGTSVVGSPVSGTGIGLDFGIQTTAGAYTVVATNVATGCTSNMAGSATITINPLPVVYTVSGGGGYCAGGTGVHITLSGSGSGINYQLYRGTTTVGSPIAGSGLSIDMGIQTSAGTYTVVATNATTGCTKNMAGSATVAINPVPEAFAVTGGGSYCAGGTGLHVGLMASVSGVNYQLFRGTATVGAPMPGTGAALDFGIQATAGTYTVVGTDAATSCTNNMSGSVAITVNALPIIYSVAGGGNYCAGGTGVDVFTSGSETGVGYQLYNGTTLVGSPVAGTGASLDFGMQTTSGVYTVVATNTATMCTRNMIGSATVTINALPAAYVVSGGGSYCAGGTGFHVSIGGSATGITYQLNRDALTVGSPVAGTGTVIDFGIQTAGGTYTVVATNTATGCTNNMTGSVVITVNPLPVAFSVTGGGNNCAGGPGVNIGLSGSSNGINYQVYNGTVITGSPVAGTGAVLDLGLQALAGTYTVAGTDAITGCTNNMTGSTVVTVTPVVIPSVSISTGLGDSVCAGTSVVFNAPAVNAGPSPAYLWKVNGMGVGTGSSYTYIPVNGDVVSVDLTSNATCAIPATANSTMTITVRDNLSPVVNVTATQGDTVCQSTAVSFVAAPVNGGTAPSYLWKLNGSSVGTGTTYNYVPSDNDIVYCIMSSNYPCLISNTVLSSQVTMKVESNVAPTVAIALNAGTSVGGIIYNDTLMAIVSNGGYGLSYQWSINGSEINGATSATFIQSSLNNNDAVTCYVVNNNVCGSQSGSNTVVITSMNVGVKPVVTASSEIRLVPNPNNGTFTIKGTLGIATDEEVSIEITDVLGQVIYADKIMARKGEINEKITLSNSIANGMYLLSLHAETGNKVFHMVIKQ